MSYLRVIMTVFLLVGTAVAQDVDLDGVPDSVDNCPATYNPDQEDFDLDGVGDSCDNCMFVANTDQWDWDQDGKGSACDTIASVCGNVDNDPYGYGDYNDILALIEYLYNAGPAPEYEWMANVDGYEGVNNADIQCFIDYANTMDDPPCHSYSIPIPTSEEIVEVRMLDVPPGRDVWTTELWIWLSAYDEYGSTRFTGFAFPFSYSCATSGITLDSITLNAGISELTHTVIDTVASTGLIGINQWWGELSSGYWKMASMHFSLTPSSQTQRIIIDTTMVPPSNTIVLTKFANMNSVPQIFGIPGNMTCCVGGTGNVNCDPADNVDVADLSVLIDHMFITHEPLCCRDEADVNHDGRNDISDLTKLINHLFITFESIGPCPYD